jgi:hypothetical protein
MAEAEGRWCSGSRHVEGNGAFLELAASPDVDCSIVVQEQNKKSLFGEAVKRK